MSSFTFSANPTVKTGDRERKGKEKARPPLDGQARKRNQSHSRGIVAMERKREFANEDEESIEKNKKMTMYKDLTLNLPLYRAALEGNWETAEEIFDKDPDAKTAKIFNFSETALHIAVGTGHSNKFVEKLVYSIPVESLEKLTDKIGNTVLHCAAVVGNTKAAKILVERNSSLPQIRNEYEEPPLHRAAAYGHKKTARYLLSVTHNRDPSPFSGTVGVELLILLIKADFLDMALDLLNLYPALATGRNREFKTAFETLAQKPQAFASGSQLNCWQCLVYRFIPVAVDNVPPEPTEHGDVESLTGSSKNRKEQSKQFGILQYIYPIYGSLRKPVLWILKKVYKILGIKHIHHTKLMHVQADKLAKLFCKQASLTGAMATTLLENPMLTASRLGIQEIVKEIIKTHPSSVWKVDANLHNIFQLAVLHRQEKIFNLIFQMSLHKHFFTACIDRSGNNILHLAGMLQPSNRVSGAALQMQRELQWFKEVEKIVQPSFKDQENKSKKTPRMEFTEAHQNLVKQGEEWMKGTASSCTVVAALVATVVFAAAFTVPGGNNGDQGIPIFLTKFSFMIFAVSDALALFSSSTSVMMFLGILTSRYSEEDFFKSLPNRLIIGLVTLFFSIGTMVVAFSAALQIVLVHRVKWVGYPIALMACVPVTLFGYLQFPLLLEILFSTLGRNIFRRESKEIIH